jgi:hypothetical protein
VLNGWAKQDLPDDELLQRTASLYCGSLATGQNSEFCFCKW